MAAEVPQSPPRAGGNSACGSNVNSPPQAWGHHGLGEGPDSGSSGSLPHHGAGTSSPWQFQLNVKAASRVRSGERTGISTPVLAQRFNAQRALSSGRTTAAQPPARASYESALLNAVRRQIETFEEKVGSQISSLRDQQQGERLREAAFQRLEEKMNTAEGLQPRLDRRLAELTGNFKGLSDEMQAQIRRVDLMDERLWEWRRQFEEEFRQKHMELENSIQKVPSSMRVMASSIEDGQKRLGTRLQRLEADFGERNALHDDTRNTLDHVFARFDALESQRLEDHGALIEATKASLAALPSRNMIGDDNSTLITVLEQRLDDLMAKVDRMFQDTHDIHARVAEQDEQQKTLRTLFETTDGHVRALKEVVENGNWDGKVEVLRQALQEESRLRLEHHERMELLHSRVEFQEQVQEEMRTSQRTPLRVLDGEDGVQNAPVQECVQRLEQVETHLELLDAELEGVRADTGVGARVAELVLQLKEIGPKIIDHERFIMDFRTSHVGAVNSERMVELEDQLAKLTSKVNEAGSTSVPLEVHTELSSLRSEVDAWRQSTGGEEVATLAKLNHAVSLLRDEVRETIASSTRDPHPTLLTDLEAVKLDLVSLKSQPQAAELSPAMLADFEALKKDLDSLKSRPQVSESNATGHLLDLEAVKQDILLMKDQLQVSESDATGHLLDLEAVKQDILLMKDKLQATESRTAVAADVEALKQDLGALKSRPEVHPAVTADIEALKSDLGSLKSRPEAAEPSPAAVADLEALKQEFSAWKAMPQVSHDDLAKTLEPLKQELRSFSQGLPDRGGAEASGASTTALQELKRLTELAASEHDVVEGVKANLREVLERVELLKGIEHELSKLREVAESSKQVAGAAVDEIGALRNQCNALTEVQPLKQELQRLTALDASAREAQAAATTHLLGLKEDLAGLTVRLQALEDKNSNGASAALPDEALREELRKEIASRSAPDAAWTEQVHTVTEELRRLTQLSASSEQAVNGALGEIGELQRQMGEVRQGKAVTQAAMTEAVETLRQELALVKSQSKEAASHDSGALVEGVRQATEAASAALQTAHGIRQDVQALRLQVDTVGARSGETEALRQELKSLADSVPRGQDTTLTAGLDLLRQDLDALAKKSASSAEVVSQGAFDSTTERLRDEISELKKLSSAVSEEVAKGKSADIELLREELLAVKAKAHEVSTDMEHVKRKASEAGGSGVADIQRLKADVEALQTRLAAGTLPAGDEVAAELAEEEEAERVAHQQLLLRVDELCERISAVDKAIATAAATHPQARLMKFTEDMQAANS
uniref:Uncharacterized protein n=1 Tax=Alexandrium monilatum TaxID=311494 RepID=A0A7S4W0W5_9DINO